MLNTQARIGVLVVFLVGFLALVGAYVALVVTGHTSSVAALFAGAVSLLTGAGIIGHQQVMTNTQDKQLNKIEQQTNGALTRRMHETAVQAARMTLREAGVPGVPDAAAPIPPPPPSIGSDGVAPGTGAGPA